MKRNSLFWGLAFVFVGALFLLNTLDLLRFSVWRIIWPGLVILLGIWVLWQSQTTAAPTEVETVTLPLEGSQRARLTIQHGAGTLKIGRGAASQNLLEGRFTGGVEQFVERSADELDVTLKVPHDGFPFVAFPLLFSTGDRIAWDVQLNSQIPLTLDVRTGANDAQLDLSDLQVTDLELQTGVSATEIALPRQAEFTRLKVGAGVASVKFKVPENVAARVLVDGGLLGVEVDQTRFPKVASAYQSPTYADAAQRVEININAGVGSVSVQ